tara:strand:- start:33 stop:209 length:177 start_codon:yes stop_codon:yes gene_type:complete
MLKIEFETGNDAFADENIWSEIKAVLDKTWENLSEGKSPIKDSNGNTIGYVEFEMEKN